MRFLNTLFNRSTNTNRRSVNQRSKTLSLESLEQRIALDASGIRPQLEPVCEVYIDKSLVGVDPVVFEDPADFVEECPPSILYEAMGQTHGTQL